jgi:hypothetical protein
VGRSQNQAKSKAHSKRHTAQTKWASINLLLAMAALWMLVRPYVVIRVPPFPYARNTLTEFEKKKNSWQTRKFIS